MKLATATPARILIVEDDADAAHLLESLLRAAGYQVIGSAGNGREAIQLAESARPDLVIMDIVLPGDLDGIETAAILAERQDIPVLYLTAYSDEELYARARATSPLAYLSKPYNERELQRAIDLALDRHALLRRLKASEAHLAEAQAVAHIGSWHWHLLEDRVEVSDELLRLLGLAPGTFEPRFDTFLQMACAADRPVMLEAMETLLRGEEAGEIDVRLDCADTPERVLRLLGHAHFDRMGRAYEMVGTARDITAEWLARSEANAYREQLEAKVAERTAELSASNLQLQGEIENRLRMEEALWRNEQRYRSLVDNLPEPLLVMQDDQVVFANPALARLLGLPVNTAMLGMPLTELVHPDFYQACEACKQDTLSGKQAKAPIVLKLCSVNGGSIEVEALTFAFDYEGSPAVLAVMRDLTARRAMEQTAERFRVALDSSPDAVCLIDPESMRFVDVNETACAWLGYSREEMLRLGPQDLLPLFNKTMLREQCAAAFDGKPGAAIVQTLHQGKDGGTFPVEIRIRHFESGGQSLIVAVASDISERIRAEAELRESNARFQQLAENIDEMFWVRDLVENRFLYISPAYEKLFGKRVDSLYHHPRSFLTSIHPDDRDRVAAAHDSQRTQPSGLDLEYRVVVEGRIRWLWVRTFPIFGADGKVYRTVGVAKEVTERREAEEQYRAIIQASMDGFWMTDAQGHIYDCNDAACRISGYGRAELLGLSVLDLEASETPEQTAEHIRRMIKNEADRFETRHRRKNGQVIDIDASVYFRATPDGGNFFSFLRDITERKQAERTLIESEARFAKVFNRSPIGIAITRMDDGHIVDFNPAIRQILGYERDELLGHTTLELGLWAQPEQRDEALQRLRQDGHVHNMELRMQHKCGEISDGMISMEHLDLNGVPHLLSLVMDISDRKRIEEALRRERDNNRRYLDTAQTLMVALDAGGRITMINRMGCQLLGYTESELLGRNWFECCLPQPQGMETVFPFFLEAISGNIEETKYFENEVLCRDGSLRLFAWHNAYLTNDSGRIVGTLSSGEDITERKLSEQALRNSEMRFRLLFEHSPIGIAMTDLKGNFIQVNPALCGMLGYSAAQLTSKTFMEITHPDDISAGLALFRQAQENAIPGFQIVKRYLHRDGQVLWGNLTSRLIRDQSGKPLYSLGMIENITERIDAEQQRLTHEARQRDALVREVHHRIKNNLQGVIGLLRQDIATHPDTRTPIEAAIAQINTIAVVHGLQGRVPRNELRLRELLREVNGAVAALAMLPQSPRIEDTLSGDVWLDSNAAVSIALILNELIHNALKHGRHSDGMRVAIALGGDSQQAAIHIVNPGGPLPAGFDLGSGQGCGTGLDLIRTLLPRRGATLTIREVSGRIETALLLGPPLTTEPVQRDNPRTTQEPP